MKNELKDTRQYNLDLMKAVAIISMVFCHPVLRLGMYTLGYGLVSGEFPDETLYAFLCQDILQFAGVALVATGIFIRIGLRESHILATGLILSVIGTAVPDVDTGHYVLNTLLGTFLYTTEETSCFCFANWYIFVASGLVFGKILQSLADKDFLYRKLQIVSGCIAAVYIASTCIFGVCFLSRNHYYYTVSPLEAAGLMSIDLFVLSSFHFLLKKTDVSEFRVFVEMSMNITRIYFIHWIILGFIEVVFCYLNEMVFTYPLIYSIGAVLLIVSSVLARKWKYRKVA